MAGFTKGPWRVARKSFGSALISANSDGGGSANGGIYVAQAKGPDNRANALLIAAAPDGHSIAGAIVELEAQAEHLPEPISSELLAIIDSAKAYLAKVEGSRHEG